MTFENHSDREIVPWDVLCSERTNILRSIERRWYSLVENPKVKESQLQEFLAKHASLFFGKAVFVISRAELGSDFQVDFVLATDEASYGIGYTFVEIETPQSVVYTRGGDPAARLTHAMQQVRNWKAWLARHRGHVRRFFPSVYWGREEFTNFSYCIVIGRRATKAFQSARRNILARENGISIRSFGHFTDMIRLSRVFLPTLAPHADCGKPGPVILNRLANPFAQAYSWRAWKSVVDQPHLHCCHFVAKNAESLLLHRTYNSGHDTFLKWWRSLSARKRADYLSRGETIKSSAEIDDCEFRGVFEGLYGIADDKRKIVGGRL